MKKIFVTAVSFLFLFSSCSVSVLTSSWKAPDFTPKKYKKIIVVGLVRNEDQSMRQKLEQHLVEDLKTLGYDAVCSCDEFSPKIFENLTEHQAISKLKNSGIDAVITVVLLNKVRERNYVSSEIYNTPYVIYQEHFWGYYRTMRSRVYSEGYYVTSTEYFWESNLYDLQTDQLIYSARSRAFDPPSTEMLGHDYGRMLIHDLVNKQVLTEQKKELPTRAM